jgi:RHS repeat-associated protein
MFEYDGLGRLVRASDNNDPADVNDDSTVRYQYDSLSRDLVEDQNGRLVRSRYDGLNNKLGLTYPNGRVVRYTYDGLDRIDQIITPESGNPLVDYNYIGPGRTLSRTYSNGVRLARTYDAVRRIVKHEHRLANSQQLAAGFEYDYDRENNRRLEVRTHDGGRGDVFVYDSAYRVVDYKRDVMNPRAEANQPGSGSPMSARAQYTIDGANNWRLVGFGAMPTQFVPNVMNEYEMVGGVTQAHDENGNLLDDGQRRFVSDVFNRLVRVENKTNGASIAAYSYDAHNRRVMKRAVGRTTLFFYDGWRDIEEQDASGRTLAQYVNGRALDEVVTMDGDVRGDGRPVTFFYHDNAAVMSAAALTDDQGRVVERYNYDLYGEPIVIAASGATGMESTVGNPLLYQGRRWDAETGLYYYRHRYYDPQTGRFLQRDPIGLWHDALNHGNPMTYVANNPWNSWDPSGLQSQQPPPPPDLHDFFDKLGRWLSRLLPDTPKPPPKPSPPVNAEEYQAKLIQNFKCWEKLGPAGEDLAKILSQAGQKASPGMTTFLEVMSGLESWDKVLKDLITNYIKKKCGEAQHALKDAIVDKLKGKYDEKVIETIVGGIEEVKEVYDKTQETCEEIKKRSGR